MVEWNGIFRLFRFSGILGQPREVNPKFRNEIPENVCSIRSPTRNFRNFWSNGKRPRTVQRSNQKWKKTVKQDGSQKVIWRERTQKRSSIFRVASGPLSFPFSALLASQGFWYPRISIFFGTHACISFFSRIRFLQEP